MTSSSKHVHKKKIFVSFFGSTCVEFFLLFLLLIFFHSQWDLPENSVGRLLKINYYSFLWSMRRYPGEGNNPRDLWRNTHPMMDSTSIGFRLNKETKQCLPFWLLHWYPVGRQLVLQEFLFSCLWNSIIHTYSCWISAGYDLIVGQY